MTELYPVLYSLWQNCTQCCTHFFLGSEYSTGYSPSLYALPLYPLYPLYPLLQKYTPFSKNHRARAIFARFDGASSRFMILRHRARAVYFCVCVYVQQTEYNGYSAGGAR
jgi:hypothetical protein